MLKNRLIFLTDQAKKYILLGVLFRELGLIAQIVSVFQIGDILYATIRQTMTNQLLYRVAAVCAVCFILQTVSARMCAKMQAASVTDIKRNIREQIYDKIISLGVSYREKVSQAEVIRLCTDGVDEIEAFYEKFLPQLILSITAPITLCVFMAIAINVRSALFLLLVSLVLPVLAYVLMRTFKAARARYYDSSADLTQHFMENLRGLPTLKLYRADDIKAEEIDREAENFRINATRMLGLDIAIDGLIDVLALLGSLAGIMTGISEYIYGTFSMTGCIMLIILAGEYFLPTVALSRMLRNADAALTFTAQIEKFLALREPLYGTREMNVPRLYSETEEVVLANMDLYERPRFLKKSAISYTLSDVHFSYDQGREVLHGVDMILPPESFISLVGPSGCGKSTLAEIICGKLKNYKGEIKVGCEGRSMNLYDIREAELLSHVVLVKTASHLFKGTIEENLRIAKKDAGEQELLDALDAVHLLTFIRERDGLQTQIEAGGANLSAGEAQRLAIARALLKDAEVLVFDEATSNIDASSEEYIMNVIRELAKRKTVLLISHRLCNVTESDCIYVMDNGLIRESGTHEELLLKRGIYNQLYRTQKALEDYSTGAATLKKSRQVLQLSGALHASTAADRNYQKIHQSLMNFAEEASGEGDSKEAGEKERRRNAPVLLAELTGLVTPSFYIVFLAVLLGVSANMCLIFVPVIAGNAVLQELADLRNTELLSSPIARHFQVMALLAFLSVLFSGGEKYLNRDAAYRILTQVRHEVYATLRRLAPSRFEKSDKGNLIRVLTADIDRLELFYGHTIGPVLTVLITCGILTFYVWQRHLYAGILTLAGFLLTGLILPILEARFSVKSAETYRNGLGQLSSFLLDQLDGIEETQQYNNADAVKQELTSHSVMLAEAQQKYTDNTGLWNMLRSATVYLCSFGMFFLTLYLHSKRFMSIQDIVTCTLVQMFSFQAVRSVSDISADIGRTLAGGERILRILEDRPDVQDVSEAEGKLGWDGYKRFHGAEMSRVTFAYDKDVILRDFTILLWPKQLIGIHGASGSGKSTVLKLLLRFWDVSEGSISICGEDIRNIATRRLRDAESYMAQDTVIFHDSIANNIAIGKPGASRVEIIRAAKKAALHEFILSLPKGYDTQVDELGYRLSDGERKRIGIARAFLHNAPLILLDEPSEHLDSLNECMILKAMEDECKDKTIVIASTRDSAMRACDTVFEMNA